MGTVTTLESLETLRAGALAQQLPSKFNIPVASLLCCPGLVITLCSESPPLWLPASLVLVLCLCRFRGSCFLGVATQADLEGIVGSVPDCRDKANLTKKCITQMFWFPCAYKSSV